MQAAKRSFFHVKHLTGNSDLWQTLDQIYKFKRKAESLEMTEFQSKKNVQIHKVQILLPELSYDTCIMCSLPHNLANII